ncbi:GGDEF domain-containing protein [Saccharobesus litoralis]|uniref:diguanylate cyclase n=1 Tax=Saccharobesus litoralis TaxID=2172099 RepID=A0A2S0VTK4_9ALTE|nr:GGDEF domain-containing protein [Saccharobesus litoralis]AWB67541.1 GGDEF domain-containing protein [Saccharobesus litoralis]
MDNLNHFNTRDSNNVMHLPNSSVAVVRDEFEPNFNHLVERLHTSLKVTDILQMYTEEAAKYVDLTGMRLQTESDCFETREFSKGVFNHISELMLFDKRLGILNYACSSELDIETVNVLSLLQAKLAYPIRNALAVADLQKQALNDSLTGLGNRGFFEEKFSSSVERALANQENYTLVLLDLDNFKQANDTWGHAEGDKVLIEFARILENSVRKTDLVFRFGGDEFAIILDGANQSVATRISRLIKAEAGLSSIMTKMGVSTSIGVCQLKAEMDHKALFSQADKALYQAKNAGRNCLRTA